MGLQDRDYMKDRHKKQCSQSNVNWVFYTPPSKRKVKFKSAFFLLLFLALPIFFDYVLPKTSVPKRTIFITMPQRVPDLVHGGMALTVDHQGHFRGTFLVNNVPMPFMIDTGATLTAIPEKMAQSMGLPVGRSVYSDTAGGKVHGYETHIDSLSIGTAELKNLDAIINPYIQEGLIGMNTLKFFKVTQENNTLTMVLSDNPAETAEIQTLLSAALHK